VINNIVVGGVETGQDYLSVAPDIGGNAEVIEADLDDVLYQVGTFVDLEAMNSAEKGVLTADFAVVIEDFFLSPNGIADGDFMAAGENREDFHSSNFNDDCVSLR
jgi:hypothetical protein